MSPLPESEIKLISRRLRFPSVLSELCMRTAFLRRGLPGLVGSEPSRWVDYLDEFPEQALYVAYLTSGNKERHYLLKYMTDWKDVKPYTNGHDLKACGLPPGPAYQNLLRRLREAWLNGEINSRQEELNLLERLMDSVEKT
jgi:tRNA nucleotidyltransferase (CCA-adding enzyme)